MTSKCGKFMISKVFNSFNGKALKEKNNMYVKLAVNAVYILIYREFRQQFPKCAKYFQFHSCQLLNNSNLFLWYMALVWQPTRFQCVYLDGVPLLPLLQRLLWLLLFKLMSKNYAWNVSVHNPFIYEWKFIIDLIFGAHTKKLTHSMANATKKMHQTLVYRSRHNSNALRSHVPFTYIATELKLGRALIRSPSHWLAHTSAHAHYTTIDTYETFFFYHSKWYKHNARRFFFQCETEMDVCKCIVTWPNSIYVTQFCVRVTICTGVGQPKMYQLQTFHHQ